MGGMVHRRSCTVLALLLAPVGGKIVDGVVKLSSQDTEMYVVGLPPRWRVCFRSSTPVLYRGLRAEALGVSGVAERVDPRHDRCAQAAALRLDAR